MSEEIENIEVAQEVEVVKEPVRKAVLLDNIMAVPGKDGVFVDRKTLNYVYFNDHSITCYYKEGFIEEIPYNDELIAAMNAIQNAEVPAKNE